MEGDLIWGGKYTIQYADDISQICAPQQIQSIKTKKEEGSIEDNIEKDSGIQ